MCARASTPHRCRARVRRNRARDDLFKSDSRSSRNSYFEVTAKSLLSFTHPITPTNKTNWTMVPGSRPAVVKTP